MDSLLLSYIDVRHTNLLPPGLTVGEARDLGPRYTTAKDLALVRDASIELVSQSRRVHILIEDLEAPIQVAEPAAADSVNSLEAEADQEDNEMVVKRKMGLARFVPRAHLSGQQQPPPVRSQTPSPAPARS